MSLIFAEPVIVTPKPLDECLEERNTFIWPEIDTIGVWDDSPIWPAINPRVPLELARLLGATIDRGYTYTIFIEGCPVAWWSAASGEVKPYYRLAVSGGE